MVPDRYAYKLIKFPRKIKSSLCFFTGNMQLLSGHIGNYRINISVFYVFLRIFLYVAGLNECFSANNVRGWRVYYLLIGMFAIPYDFLIVNSTRRFN